MIAIQQSLNEHLKLLLNEPTKSQVLRFPIDQGEVVVEFSALNDLASSFESLLYAIDLSGINADELQTVSSRLAERISYLPETLRVVECDVENLRSQIRSETPAPTPQGVCYFEIAVGASGVMLSRYCKPADAPRKRIDMTLTHEILARVIGDISRP